MKQFNKNIEEKKLSIKQNKSTYIKRLGISLACLTLVSLIILFTFAKFETSSEEYTLINGVVKTCEEGKVWDFDYTGNYQEFKVPCEGYYRVELWGARGEVAENYGYAAYTAGTIQLSKNKRLYIYVGEQAKSYRNYNDASYRRRTFNGGGAPSLYDNTTTTSISTKQGGGATDVRYFGVDYEPTSDELKWDSTLGLRSRVMVAAGTGGDSLGRVDGSWAGGLSGYNGTGSVTAGTGGTQTSAGSLNATFGIGGDANRYTWGAGSGGGGYYGGGSGTAGTYLQTSSGGGGSSFISGHTGAVAITSANNQNPRTGKNGASCTTGTVDNLCSQHYSGLIFTDTKMIDGKGYPWTNVVGTSYEQMPNPGGGYYDEGFGHVGNGYARITYLGENYCPISEGTTYTYDYLSNAQEFSALCDGNYKVELWGAQGGGTTSSSRGGYGSYTSGSLQLNKSDKLYVYVGNQPARTENAFNGGGQANNTYYPTEDGGGATDIRYFGNTVPTSSELAWNYAIGLNSRIMVAAAGGGGTGSLNNFGGAGGGLNGYNGLYNTPNNSYSYPTGATQTKGGTKDQYSGSDGSFGKGGNGELTYGGGAGGSGYYGGGGGANNHHISSGAGGSSYISGHAGSIAIASGSTTEPRAIKSGCSATSTSVECSIHYSGLFFTNTIMIDGQGYKWTTTKAATSAGMPTHDGTSTMTGNSGNGYAKITFLGR